MLEAVSVALHAVSLSQVSLGETALVLGAGMIGLLPLESPAAPVLMSPMLSILSTVQN
jgi:L-iditol 2-dehydrogenase